MKYRIKIITYKNDRKEYVAQVKKLLFGWSTIASDGKDSFNYEGKCDSRREALRRIDLHFEGNCSEHSIEFEYITK